MFQKIAKHRANDASNDVHRPSLHAHKESQKPEDLREIEPEQSLDLSQASGFREEITSSNAEEEDSDVDEEAERISSEMEATNQCHFCDYRAPVPWVHPSKGTNLSGRDIWDHVWAEHPRESEQFAWFSQHRSLGAVYPPGNDPSVWAYVEYLWLALLGSNEPIGSVISQTLCSLWLFAK